MGFTIELSDYADHYWLIRGAAVGGIDSVLSSQ